MGLNIRDYYELVIADARRQPHPEASLEESEVPA